MMIYEDIFEAIRAFTPNHPFLSLKDDPLKPVVLPKPSLFMLGVGQRPTNKFIAVPKTYTDILCPLPKPMNTMDLLKNMVTDTPQHFYRGECQVGNDCIPSTFRFPRGSSTHPEFETVIDMLKTLDFCDIAEIFPQVKEAQKQGLICDPVAIAQHYGLKTNIIDWSSEIFIAAFFATHQFNRDTQEYEVATEGEGCLRHHFSNSFSLGKNSIKPVGLQPFKRPILQYAYGITLPVGIKLDGGDIIFKQNAEMNERIHNLYINDSGNILFPKELIADVADVVRNSKSITRKSVNKLINLKQHDSREIKRLIRECGYTIVDKLVFVLTKKQSKNEIHEIETTGLWGDCTLYYRKEILSAN